MAGRMEQGRPQQSGGTLNVEDNVEATSLRGRDLDSRTPAWRHDNPWIRRPSKAVRSVWKAALRGMARREADAFDEVDQNHPRSNIIRLYDIFFVANLTIFTTLHEITTVERLAAYIGYFSVVWFLWLTVMFIDVYSPVVSKPGMILYAIHVGTMVGSCVVAPGFDPTNQLVGTFRVLCMSPLSQKSGLQLTSAAVMLAVSRAALAMQYGLFVFDLDMSGRVLPVISCACHLIAAIIYLGISFLFSDGSNSRAYIAWYIVGFVEATAVFFAVWRFWDFGGGRTAVDERMATVTLLFLGASIITVAEHVNTTMKNVYSWNSTTIGILTAIIALIYTVCWLYLEWLSPAHPGTRLYFWILCHFPLHLALMLLIEGSVQLLVCSKVMELIRYLSDEFYNTFLTTRGTGATSITRSIVEKMNGTVNSVWELYHPERFVTFLRAEALLSAIGTTPDSFWTMVPGNMEADSRYQNVTGAFRSLYLTVLNSVLDNLKVGEIEGGGWPDDPSTYKSHALEDVADKLCVVYIYVFCAAGGILILLTILHFLSQRLRPRGIWSKPPIALNMILGIGLMLLASMARHDAGARFITTPWVIPTICLIFVVDLVITLVTHVRVGPLDE